MLYAAFVGWDEDAPTTPAGGLLYPCRVRGKQTAVLLYSLAASTIRHCLIADVLRSFRLLAKITPPSA